MDISGGLEDGRTGGRPHGDQGRRFASGFFEDSVAMARWVLVHADSCPPARVRTAQRILASARVRNGDCRRDRLHP